MKKPLIYNKEAFERNSIVLLTEFKGLPPPKRGKVRDIYDLGTELLIVATDRISAFDVVLPNGIPNKGRVLTQISKFWFNKTSDIIPNHLISTDVGEYPEAFWTYRDFLQERSMLVKKATPIPVECIVRGYISGSGWKDYKRSGSISGVSLPPGLLESSKLESPIFTPSTKAEEGKHDENISFGKVVEILGEELAHRIKKVSIDIYNRSMALAEKKGIIIADTKFEFGIDEDRGELILIDELLTPDSSRFWPKDEYQPGRQQRSFDKQFVRDYLISIGWNQKPPAPSLPQDVIEKTTEKYIEAFYRLTA
ncbi:MAG: phosphoribosylaminoimidazolesuccinocarboxamide synthase [Candidatus Dadabacteria bacterium]|nr:phosphoribosylaminoimidazolesuccinocarboxamide synthase [Candidatus Dadabacteria bacterium]